MLRIGTIRGLLNDLQEELTARKKTLATSTAAQAQVTENNKVQIKLEEAEGELAQLQLELEQTNEPADLKRLNGQKRKLGMSNMFHGAERERERERERVLITTVLCQ